MNGVICAFVVVAVLGAGQPSALAGTCPSDGDCCTANGTPGCNDFDCCDVAWDAGCAILASQTCTECIPPFDCSAAGDCCVDHGAPGCDDRACCEAVCTLDPRCCDTGWNADCALTANLLCGELGEEYCGFCPGSESCCETHDSPGCDRQACCDIVCGLDPSCCTDRWRLSCRREAIDSCASTVCDCDAPGDFDGDGLVTLADVADFMNCYTGTTGVPLDTPCACADFNGDGLADAKDTRALIDALTGP